MSGSGESWATDGVERTVGELLSKRHMRACLQLLSLCALIRLGARCFIGEIMMLPLSPPDHNDPIHSGRIEVCSVFAAPFSGSGWYDNPLLFTFFPSCMKRRGTNCSLQKLQ